MEKLIMPFGEYAGEYLEDVVTEKTDYIKWLMNQDWFKYKFKNLYREAEKLLEEMGIN